MTRWQSRWSSCLSRVADAPWKPRSRPTPPRRNQGRDWCAGHPAHSPYTAHAWSQPPHTRLRRFTQSTRRRQVPTFLRRTGCLLQRTERRDAVASRVNREFVDTDRAGNHASGNLARSRALACLAGIHLHTDQRRSSVRVRVDSDGTGLQDCSLLVLLDLRHRLSGEAEVPIHSRPRSRDARGVSRNHPPRFDPPCELR